MKKLVIGIMTLITALIVFSGTSYAMTQANVIAHEKALTEEMSKILKNQTVSAAIWPLDFEDNNIFGEAAVVVQGDFNPTSSQLIRIEKAFEKELNQDVVFNRRVTTQYETFIYFKPAK
jgi:hypothetical protein